jgi:ABC-2 type transport system ATP-binding protein
MQPIVEATGLTKRYGEVEALAGLDLVAPAGKVLALLGPNGAGKTTFVRAIATLTRPDAGSLRVAGIDVSGHPDHVRRVIGLAGQYAAVEPAMSGRENVRMIARLFGHGRRQSRVAADAILDQLGLADAADRLVRTYSGGMRRRLDLGASLVGAPRLLLLDEPTTGLDPRSRIDLWDAIRSLVDRGTNVLLTTQYLDEADHLAGQIVIIDHGKTIASGTPAELKQRAGRNVIEVHVRDREDVAEAAKALAQIGDGEPQIDESTRRVSVVIEGGTERLNKAMKPLEKLGITLDDVALRQPKLDEVFLALTGQVLKEDDGATETGDRDE